jgi:hypothetical protein
MDDQQEIQTIFDALDPERQKALAELAARLMAEQQQK